MRQPNAKDRGMILVVVLWSVSMMAIIVVALSAYAQRNLISAGIEMDRLRTEMALRSGVELGVGRLLARPMRERVFLDGSAENLDLGGGLIVAIGIRDPTGLIDINRMDGAFLQRAIEQVTGSPEAAVELSLAILDRRKLAEGETRPVEQPAEDQEPPTLPAVFSSISELYGLQVPERGVMPALMAVAGLYSRGGRINPMAAPEAILQAIPEITPGDISELQAAKQRKDAAGPRVQNIFARYEKYITSAETMVFDIEVRIVAGGGVIAGSRVRATIILDSSGNVPFRVLAWSW